MSEDVYKKLAKVLDSLPNGFPETPGGTEIAILKKVFTPEEAEIFCDLKLTFETPEQIAMRTGRDAGELADKLYSMWERGQVFMVDFGTAKVFKMLPWVFGIFEFQLNRMDPELARLCADYEKLFYPQFFGNTPQLMQVLPVQKNIAASHEALAFEQVSAIIEKGQSFGVAQCICKHEKNLLGHGCDRPQEICLGIAPVPGVFENHHWGRAITKAEAYEKLAQAEDAALVHLTWNIQDGQYFICNCCGCCCGVLRSITGFGIRHAVNSAFYASIDPDLCAACGTCMDERCQVGAIEEGGDAYAVVREKCIGCGLCVSTCPTDAITLLRKPAEEIVTPPENENQWFEERARNLGKDLSAFK